MFFLKTLKERFVLNDIFVIVYSLTCCSKTDFILWKIRHFDFIYTGAGHIIRISSKSWFISLIPFKKWNLYNVYIHSTQTDIFQVFIL